jgi:hypothetical protein
VKNGTVIAHVPRDNSPSYKNGYYSTLPEHWLHYKEAKFSERDAFLNLINKRGIDN